MNRKITEIGREIVEIDKLIYRIFRSTKNILSYLSPLWR